MLKLHVIKFKQNDIFVNLAGRRWSQPLRETSPPLQQAMLNISVVGAGKQICSGVTCGLTCQNLIVLQAQYPIQTYL